MNHPQIEEFKHKEWLTSYITELYAVIMDALDVLPQDEEEVEEWMTGPEEDLSKYNQPDGSILETKGSAPDETREL